MKFVTVFLLTAITLVNAQQASSYFPDLGSRWYTKNTPLDSLNKTIDSASFFTTDSFALQTDYEGKFANVILTKQTSFDAVQYRDTNYIYLEGTNAWTYMQAFGAADTIPAADSIGVVTFLSSFQGWYSVFRFDQLPGAEYDIVKRDTTFVLDSTSIPLRVHVTGKRLPDETITTEAGTYTCKKFLISPSIGVVLSPMLPPLSLIAMKDTIWIAENEWVVKDIMPSTPLSFTLLGGPSFYLPGLLSERASKPTGVEEGTVTISDYSLDQNYPNPFNPETKIEFTIPEEDNIELAIYNSQGEQVSVLFKGVKPAGHYEFSFNGENLTTGIYFYRLRTGRFTSVRKMLLLK